MGQLAINGYIQAGGDGCGCSGGSGQPMEHLALACGNGTFQSIIGTDSPIQIRTNGAPGDEFVDLAVLGDFKAIELLYLKSDSPMFARIGAKPASLVGAVVPGSVNVGAGDTFNVSIDGVLVSWVPDAGTYAVPQVLAGINAAAASLGLSTPRIAYAGGRYTITGEHVGPPTQSGLGVVCAGNRILNAQLGFADDAASFGDGSDIEFQGIFMAEFRRNPYAPSRIQISGSGSVTVIAAGRTSL